MNTTAEQRAGLIKSWRSKPVDTISDPVDRMLADVLEDFTVIEEALKEAVAIGGIALWRGEEIDKAKSAAALSSLLKLTKWRMAQDQSEKMSNRPNIEAYFSGDPNAPGANEIAEYTRELEKELSTRNGILLDVFHDSEFGLLEPSLRQRVRDMLESVFDKM